MNILKKILLIEIFVSSIFATDIPRVIDYQGKLTDSIGVALNSVVSIVFRIYNADSAGSPLWEEEHPNVQVIKGLFDVQLGVTNPLNLPFDTTYYLELEVEGEVLAPRISFRTIPYAFRSIYTDTAEYAYHIIDSIATGSGNYIWNQDTVAQSASFRISGTANAGTLNVDNIRGQGYLAIEYSGSAIQVNSSSFITLFSTTYNAAGSGSAVNVSFTGTFDDRANKSGAGMEIQIVRDPGASESVLTSQMKVMASTKFYSDEVVTLNAMDFPSAGMHTYAVRARMLYEPLDAGRFVKGNMKILEIKE